MTDNKKVGTGKAKIIGAEIEIEVKMGGIEKKKRRESGGKQ